ncbi:MAG: MopE-related protein [Patescibacteria group bacterium]|nr:MopE-related protein [Patescibacteria group bacterium]
MSNGKCGPAGPVCPDADGDGIEDAACGGTDCDDSIWGVHPGGTELCNGLDDDCDGAVDEVFNLSADWANCGACLHKCLQGQWCSGGKCCGAETCNSVDDDCDGQVDAFSQSCGFDACAGGSQLCQAGAWGPCFRGGIQLPFTGYPTTEGVAGRCGNDVDDDCDGVVDCADSECSGLDGCLLVCVPTDPEVCDGKDNDCDGQIDEGLGSTACGIGQCAVTQDDCVGGVVQPCTPKPPGQETCNGLDDDCDGNADEGDPGGGSPCTVTQQLGECAKGTSSCSIGAIVCTQLVFPASEQCDGLDNNCNGMIDDGATLTFYRDADSDGFGDPTKPYAACSAPAGYVANSADCHDGNTSVHPGAAETCDGVVDDDCDGVIRPRAQQRVAKSASEGPAHTDSTRANEPRSGQIRN